MYSKFTCSLYIVITASTVQATFSENAAYSLLYSGDELKLAKSWCHTVPVRIM